MSIWGKAACGPPFVLVPNVALTSSPDRPEGILPSEFRGASRSGGAVSRGYDLGYFTTIWSSRTSNPIIWVMARPQRPINQRCSVNSIFDAGGSTKPLLFEGSAGARPIFNHCANLVLVVTNGEILWPAISSCSLRAEQRRGRSRSRHAEFRTGNSLSRV